MCAGQSPVASHVPASRPTVRHVAPGEDWEMREGRFCRNGEWVFIKTHLGSGQRRQPARHRCYHLYDEHWHSQTLDIIDGDNWPKWVKKIDVKPFVPQRR